MIDSPTSANAVPDASAVALPDPTTLAELFRRAAREYDLPDALNYKADGHWRPISSQDFLTRAENVALGLTAHGLETGDRVAILAPNSPEWTIADAGCQLAGIVDVPIYTTMAPDQVRYIIEDSGSRLLFLHNDAAYQRVAVALDDCSSLEKIVLFEAGARVPRSISFDELEASGRELRDRDPEAARDL